MLIWSHRKWRLMRMKTIRRRRKVECLFFTASAHYSLASVQVPFTKILLFLGPTFFIAETFCGEIISSEVTLFPAGPVVEMWLMYMKVNMPDFYLLPFSSKMWLHQGKWEDYVASGEGETWDCCSERDHHHCKWTTLTVAMKTEPVSETPDWVKRF